MLTLIKDLGMLYPTSTSKTKRRMYEVQCSGCDNVFTIQAGTFKAGYQSWCKECGNKQKEKK